ncbi:MAG: hypothetical protein IPO17_01085 [Flavobacteriales bacterium]|nr:hypothetical protein [Flavobacteriales bacterium]MBK9193587.1 hypothetical protein [Flavobacteriales bacterium]
MTTKKRTAMDNTRVFRMAFASVYPQYIAKAAVDFPPLTLTRNACPQE